MEKVLEDEIEKLKEEQAMLEQELKTITRPSNFLEEGGLVDVNTLQFSSFAAENETCDGGVSLARRVEQLDEMRRRHQREGKRAMQRYFDAVSGHLEYQTRREKMLNDVHSFSFEARELQKNQRIRTQRIEQERRLREKVLDETLNYRFKANPVPPSTYMNKYELMVEEWRQRRAAVEELAMLKAERMKKESEFALLTTEGLREVCELMGVRGSGRCRRAQSLGCELKGRRRVVGHREVPLEVKLKLWPTLEEHEQVRGERVKLMAAERLKELRAEEEARRAAISRSSQEQQQQQQQALLSLVSSFQPLASTADTTPQSQVLTSLVEAGLSAKPAAGAVQSLQHKSCKADEIKKQKHNFTFKPKVRGGVPDFNTMWAEDFLAMAERKRIQRATVVEPFNITPSRKDTIIRGRSRLSRGCVMSTTHTSRRCRSAVSGRSRPASSASLSVEKKRKETTKASSRIKTTCVPRVASLGVRTSRKKETDVLRQEDREAIEQRRRRNKMVSARLKEYLQASTHTPLDEVIKKKVLALREQSREMEREAMRRMTEMRARVAQKPPIFAEVSTEPTNTESARLETEKEVLRILKDSGVCDSTLTAIMAFSAGDNTGADAGGAAGANVCGDTRDLGCAALDIETKEVVDATKYTEQGADESSVRREEAEKERKTNVIIADSSSHCNNDSHRRHSTDSAFSGSSKGGGGMADYDDDFEDSSTDSTLSV